MSYTVQIYRQVLVTQTTKVSVRDASYASRHHAAMLAKDLINAREAVGEEVGWKTTRSESWTPPTERMPDPSLPGLEKTSGPDEEP